MGRILAQNLICYFDTYKKWKNKKREKYETSVIMSISPYEEPGEEF